MARRKEYTFKIDAYSPDTIPMSRLAAYLTDLATLLGEYENVHFVRLRKSSTAIVHAVEYEAYPKVRDRLQAVRRHSGPPEAMRAARDIDRRLADDNASGRIVESTGAKIIEFLGRKRFGQPKYGPFNERGTVDGIPIRIGGQYEVVPIHLEEPGQEPHICHARRDIARQIAAHLFTNMIRAEGIGRWHREPDGLWIMENFMIQSFKPISDAPLTEVVEKLRAIPSEILEVEDPLADLEKIRYGNQD